MRNYVRAESRRQADASLKEHFTDLLAQGSRGRRLERKVSRDSSSIIVTAAADTHDELEILNFRKKLWVARPCLVRAAMSTRPVLQALEGYYTPL